MKTCIILLALLTFGLAKSQNSETLKSYLPPVAGWEISPEVETFHPGNLYTRINGAAPLFIENNFREMTSLVYTRGEDYITIQAYRHETPVDAFGMYASERSPEMAFYPIGGEAQADNTSLYCFAGCVYLKIQASNESEEIGRALREIAQGMTDRIDPEKKGFPGPFRHFPTEYRMAHTEAYVASNYLGHEFLNRVFTCNYDLDGDVRQLFVLDAKTTDQAREVLRKYFEFTGQDFDVQERTAFLIEDKYNGQIPCVWNRQYLIGIYHEKGDEINFDFRPTLEQLRIMNY